MNNHGKFSIVNAAVLAVRQIQSKETGALLGQDLFLALKGKDRINVTLWKKGQAPMPTIKVGDKVTGTLSSRKNGEWVNYSFAHLYRVVRNVPTTTPVWVVEAVDKYGRVTSRIGEYQSETVAKAQATKALKKGIDTVTWKSPNSTVTKTVEFPFPVQEDPTSSREVGTICW